MAKNRRLQTPTRKTAAVSGSVTPDARQVQQVVTTQEIFSGPIPSAEVFRQYREIIPDAPERILRVFEDDSRHTREIQMAALEAQKSDNRRAHWMAFSLIFAGFVLAGFLAWLGKDWLAGITLGTTLTGTITGFLQSNSKNGKTG